ncbi:Uncharacterised protein [uncultured Clostridium sp.]|nr:hypothetical protein [uncultured Clostridium sp.]SCJ08516.1 Uncharacterised protein [uncultured Clostridium sp.]
MELKVHGFENLTIQHVQKAFDTLAKLESDKYGIEIKYTVRKKTESDK